MNKDELTNLFENNYKFYFAIVFRIVQNIADTEDILHDSFLKVYRSDKQLTGDDEIKPWFVTVCKNTALTFIEKKKKDFAREQKYAADNEQHINTENETIFMLVVEEQLSRLPEKLIPYFKEYIFEGSSIRSICKKYNVNRDKMRYWKKYLEKIMGNIL